MLELHHHPQQQLNESSSGCHLFFFFFFFSCSSSSSPSPAPHNAAEGTILLTTQTGFGCGFSTVKCLFQPDTKCFVLSVSLLGPDGGILADLVVWTANGNKPLPPDSKLHFSPGGELLLLYPNGTVAWTSNTSGRGVLKLKLKSSGNLALLTPNGTELWRSFDHPTHALLPGQRLQRRMGLTSYKSDLDLRTGSYSLNIGSHEVALRVRTSISGVTRYASWNLSGSTPSISEVLLGEKGDFRLLSRNGSTLDLSRMEYVRKHHRGRRLLFMQLGQDGSLKLVYEGIVSGVSLTAGLPGSRFSLATKDLCSLPLTCGVNGLCSQTNAKFANCSCVSSRHFTPRLRGKGFQPLHPITCDRNSSVQQLLEIQDVDYYSTHFTSGSPVGSKQECHERCLWNCSCELAIFKQISGSSAPLCYQFSNPLTLINVTGSNFTSVAFIKVEEPRPRNRTWPRQARGRVTLWVAVSLGLSTLLLSLIALMFLNRLRNKKQADELLGSIPGIPRRFSFAELRQATGSFSRKLGSGGFGAVYRGTLDDGTEVAVKRLESSKASTGEHQFKAEVMAIASVHHNNLVRLIGFCCDEQKHGYCSNEQKHTLLVYEYLPNGSLDRWIFEGAEKFLTWKTRSKVALDIAKGLAYLHEGCEQSVLHLDIKPQNILLDEEFKAKISDFGLAIFTSKVDESCKKMLVRGTPGYMAPEWLLGKVSTKIDVYSFGIVLLEIVSGMQAIKFLDTISMSLRFVHKFPVHGVRSELLLELLDPRLSSGEGGKGEEEIERFVMVALCCIQDDPAKRPGMGDVVKMLEQNLDVPADALINLKYQATVLPRGIASFLAAKPRS